MKIDSFLRQLEDDGNLRHIPVETEAVLDFSTNDYLGLNADCSLHDEFMSDVANRRLPLSSTASRLLASDQRQYTLLEQTLSRLYGRDALLFNSGYHANTGIVSAIADSRTLILADKLVHASIIDGIILSRARFTRFPHNDYERLERLIDEASGEYDTLLVIVESVYSMDGDRADIERLTAIKRRDPRVILYFDEAHAVGVLGPKGLGLCAGNTDIDIIVGTMGKALASAGAYVITDNRMRTYLLNRARSFIFSTAIPPVQAAWSRFVIERMTVMDERRERLFTNARTLAAALGKDPSEASHIVPYIVGNAHLVVSMSRQMAAEDKVKVLPIRKPTVAQGTERLRISLSAAHSNEDINRLITSLNRHTCNKL